MREDETGGQDFVLYDANGIYNGTGATVELVLIDRAGSVVDTTSKANWLVSADGTVRVLLNVGDVKAAQSPYSATFMVTLSGKTYAFPNKPHELEWRVWK